MYLMLFKWLLDVFILKTKCVIELRNYLCDTICELLFFRGNFKISTIVLKQNTHDFYLKLALMYF